MDVNLFNVVQELGAGNYYGSVVMLGTGRATNIGRQVPKYWVKESS